MSKDGSLVGRVLSGFAAGKPMRCLLLGALAFAALAAPALDKAALKSAFSAKIEALAEKMLPQKEVDEMLGFFGPVTKKYLPVFNTFNSEYLASTNKLATVRKYLPKADAAMAEARAMKVPSKYEAQKATYLKRVETFLTITKLTARFGE